MNYVFHVLIMLAIYTILVQSLNLSMGYTGMLSLCHAAFYGLGAYTSALLLMRVDAPFLVALLCALLVTGVIAYAVSFPLTRFRGDFFVLVTLAFQMIAFVVFHNWTEVTGGPYGIAGIPKPTFLGLTIKDPASFAVLALVGATAVLAITYLLVRSPFGRVLQAIREDETAALALGKDVPSFKRKAFVLSASMAAIAGVLFAGYATYIDAQVFNVEEAIFIFSALVIGGTGSFLGPIVGAAVLVLLPEALRFLQIPDAVAANMRQILYGLLLILMMRFRPQGLAGKYAFD